MLIMKFIHKFKQKKEWYLENERQIENYEIQYCKKSCYAHHDR